MSIDANTLSVIIEALKSHTSNAPSFKSNLIGQYVLARCGDGAVYAGTLEALEGSNARIKSARLLWYWKSAGRGYLNGVALDGVTSASSISAPVDVELFNVLGVLPCSDTARESILAQPDYKS